MTFSGDRRSPDNLTSSRLASLGNCRKADTCIVNCGVQDVLLRNGWSHPSEASHRRRCLAHLCPIFPAGQRQKVSFLDVRSAWIPRRAPSQHRFRPAVLFIGPPHTPFLWRRPLLVAVLNGSDYFLELLSRPLVGLEYKER
jgi:hypothetical protein